MGWRAGRARVWQSRLFWRFRCWNKEPLGKPSISGARLPAVPGRLCGGPQGDPGSGRQRPLRGRHWPWPFSKGGTPPQAATGLRLCNHKPLPSPVDPALFSGHRSAAEVRLELGDRLASVAMPCACDETGPAGGAAPLPAWEEKEEAWTWRGLAGEPAVRNRWPA